MAVVLHLLGLAMAVASQAAPIVRQEKLPETSKQASVQSHVVGPNGELLQQTATDPNATTSDGDAAAATDGGATTSAEEGAKRLETWSNEAAQTAARRAEAAAHDEPPMTAADWAAAKDVSDANRAHAKTELPPGPFQLDAGAMCSKDFPMGVDGRSECVHHEHTLILGREMCVEAARLANASVDPKTFTLKPEWGMVHPRGCFRAPCSFKSRTLAADEPTPVPESPTAGSIGDNPRQPSGSLMQSEKEAAEVCYYFNPIACKPDEDKCPKQGCLPGRPCVNQPMPNKPSSCMLGADKKDPGNGTEGTEKASCDAGHSCLDGTPVCSRPKLLLGDTPFDGSAPFTADGHCHFSDIPDTPVSQGYAVIMDEKTCLAAADCVGMPAIDGEDFLVNNENNSMYHDYPGGCFLATTTIPGKVTKHRIYFNKRPALETALPNNPQGVSVCNVTAVTTPTSPGTVNADVASLDGVKDRFCNDDTDDYRQGQWAKAGVWAKASDGINTP